MPKRVWIAFELDGDEEAAIRTQAQLQLIADLLNWRIKHEIGVSIKQIEADVEHIGQVKTAPVEDKDFVINRRQFLYANLLWVRRRKRRRFTALLRK
jgi:hypothetical protein